MVHCVGYVRLQNRINKQPMASDPPLAGCKFRGDIHGNYQRKCWGQTGQKEISNGIARGASSDENVLGKRPGEYLDLHAGL